MIHARVRLRRCRVLLYHRAAANLGLIHPDECESPFRYLTSEYARNRPRWLKLPRLLVVDEWSTRVRPNAKQVMQILELFEVVGWAPQRVRLDGINATTQECVKTTDRFSKDTRAPISFCSDGEGHMVWEPASPDTDSTFKDSSPSRSRRGHSGGG